jgi:DNA invertase Pin-like site-specific DNA recombinase
MAGLMVEWLILLPDSPICLVLTTHEQNLDFQLDAFKAATIEPQNTFTDHKSGKDIDRDGLNDALSHVRAGDTLVVWRLDRLGRTLKQLIELINELNDKDVGFKSITENIDTTTSRGKLVFHIFGALAEFEREVIRERTNAGLQAARARGRLGGRPSVESKDPKKIQMAIKLYWWWNTEHHGICRG